MERSSLRIGMLIILALALFGGYRSTHASSSGDASRLSISPAEGAPGSVVTLSAAPGSLPGNSIAEVDFQDATGLYVGLPIARVHVNADGSLLFPVATVPQAAAGDARIFVVSAGVAISGVYRVRPGISVQPATAQQKTAVQIFGSGFNSNASIGFATIGADGTAQPAPVVGDSLVIASALGSFSALIVVPRGSPVGPLQIAAGDSVYTATTTLIVTDPQALTGPAATATATAVSVDSGQPLGSPSATATGGAPTPAPASTTAAYFAEGYTGTAGANGRASFSESLNILNPFSSAATATITYFIQGSANPLVLTRTVAPQSVLRESVNADVGADRQVAVAVRAPQPLVVTRTITRIAPGGGRLDGSTTLPTGAPARTWGFPEGYNGFSFQEYLTLLNPGTTPASVHVVLAPQGDSSAGAHMLNLLVPAAGRATANIRALNIDNPTKSVGMLISSDQPIVAERVEYFGDGAGSGKFGSTVSGGIAAPSTTLHVAYGSAGSGPTADQQFITLLNPATGGAPVTVSAEYDDSTGRAIGRTSVAVNPGTRKTIVSSATVASAGTSALFSVTLRASGPIEAEAAQYYGGSPNGGTHPGVAFPAPSGSNADLAFSDLSTQLADGTPVARTVYLYNPGAATAAVAASYFGSGGAPVQTTYAVPAGAIVAIAVNQVVGQALPPGAIGAEFRVAGSGGLIAYASGRTADGLSATEDIGQAVP